ncbi:MAG: hypothetical protein MZV64_42625 [Ignavibacteriales bacterium]|nr:hypothetical protein [Ignavibacteriales bacterium]
MTSRAEPGFVDSLNPLHSITPVTAYTTVSTTDGRFVTEVERVPRVGIPVAPVAPCVRVVAGHRRRVIPRLLAADTRQAHDGRPVEPAGRDDRLDDLRFLRQLAGHDGARRLGRRAALPNLGDERVLHRPPRRDVAGQADDDDPGDRRSGRVHVAPRRLQLRRGGSRHASQNGHAHHDRPVRHACSCRESQCCHAANPQNRRFAVSTALMPCAGTARAISARR